MGEGTAHIIVRLAAGGLHEERIAAWKQAEPLQDSQVGSQISGRRHCEAVEENLGLLLLRCDPERKVPPKAVLALSLAAALHDGGKAIDSSRHAEEMSSLLRSLPELQNALLGFHLNLVQSVADIIHTHDSGEVEILPEHR